MFMVFHNPTNFIEDNYERGKTGQGRNAKYNSCVAMATLYAAVGLMIVLCLVCPACKVKVKTQITVLNMILML